MTRSSHHAKSKVGRRRSQLALKRLPLTACVNCKAPTFAHHVCPSCGSYQRQPKKERERKT